MLSFLLWAGLLATGCQAAASDSTPPAELRLDETRLRGYLQEFVTGGWGSRFQELGDEKDFDHGHVLLDAASGAPVALLYHTRELSEPAARERSWIQWFDARGVQSAERYERSSYPSSASWDWFVASDLPRLKSRHTVVDRMLDPALTGRELAPGPQWTFTRVDCATTPSDGLSVALPDRTAVCLRTSKL